MMRVALQQELELLEQAVAREAELVLEVLGDAVEALAVCDAELAERVVAFDDRVDELHMQIRHGIEALLARQTPVAIDLRKVLAMLEVNLHLERMADYCVTIAKLTRLACELNSDAAIIETFRQMGEQAAHMIRVAIDSFAARDHARAETLVGLDAVINDANRRVVHRILELGADDSLREWGLRMIVVSRCLERIGDHAVDIGEQTAFLVTGEFREFTDASHD